jgi:hypothetical protein
MLPLSLDEALVAGSKHLATCTGLPPVALVMFLAEGLKSLAPVLGAG